MEGQLLPPARLGSTEQTANHVRLVFRPRHAPQLAHHLPPGHMLSGLLKAPVAGMVICTVDVWTPTFLWMTLLQAHSAHCRTLQGFCAYMLKVRWRQNSTEQVAHVFMQGRAALAAQKRTLRGIS